MPAPWVAGAQARLIGELHGQQTVNVFNFATNAAILDQAALDTLLLELATALLSCATTTLLGAVSQDWTLKGSDAKKIYPVLSDPMVATAPAMTIGTLGVTSVSFAAQLAQIRTGGGGRRGRGRVFLPPPGEANIAQSAIDATAQAALVAFLACLAGKFMGLTPTTSWVLGVLSRKTLAGVPSNFNTAFRPAVSLSPSTDLAVMRSRRKGHGA